MRAIIQLVTKAQVSVEDKVVGQIGQGLLVLLAIHKDDQEKDIFPLLEKMVNLRIFKDDQGKMNLSLLDVKGEMLIISQFTLYADCSKGRRPSFFDSALPEKAKPLYEKFIQEAKKVIPKVETGSFGAYMQVSLINDGPITIILP